MKSNVFFLFVTLLFVSCGKSTVVKSNGDDSRFYVDGNSGKISTLNKIKFPEWVEIGVECYGLIVYPVDKDIMVGIPVSVKIIKEKKDGYKCETLEDAMLYEGIGCDKLGVNKGETWWETDGDLYRTKEDAIESLKKRDWYFEL